MICISIGNIEKTAVALELGPDIVELRFDLFRGDLSQVITHLKGRSRLIATCRPGNHSDAERLSILRKAMEDGVEYIDIELDAESSYSQELMGIAFQTGTEIIVSWHDYHATPPRDDLKSILKSCYLSGAHIAKIACLVNNSVDNANLMSLYAMEGRKVILGMGAKGRISRLAALSMGAEFTFVSADDENFTAPGQLTYKEYVDVNKIINRI